MEELANEQTFRSYLFFWSGQLFSLLGSLIVFFVLMVWITDVTGSALMLSLANFIYMVPMLIITPIAGVLSDRHSRKGIILVVDSLQAFLTVILTFLFLFNFEEIWIVFLFIGFRSICQSFHSPTVTAIMPSMVPRDRLGQINGINYFFTGIIQLIGPAVGATLLLFFSIKYVLWVDVITYIIALIPLLAIKVPNVYINTNNLEKNSFIRDMKEGFEIIKAIPGLSIIMVVAMLFNMLIQPLIVLMPFYIKIVHKGDNFLLALLEMILQGGMIIGALIPTFKKKWKNSARTMFIGIVIINIGYLMYAIAPIGSYPVMGSGAFMLGFILPIVNTIVITIVQKTVPQEKMGRVTSLLFTLSGIASPLGAIISGPLSELLGVSWLYLYCAIMGLIIAVIAYFFTNLRNVDYDKEINDRGKKIHEKNQKIEI